MNFLFCKAKNQTMQRALWRRCSHCRKKYKDVVYLYYYEGYSAVEIAEMLNKNANTVYTLLARARNMLKEKLKYDEF